MGPTKGWVRLPAAFYRRAVPLVPIDPQFEAVLDPLLPDLLLRRDICVVKIVVEYGATLNVSECRPLHCSHLDWFAEVAQLCGELIRLHIHRVPTHPNVVRRGVLDAELRAGLPHERT